MNLFKGIHLSFILLVAEARNAETFLTVEGTELARFLLVLIEVFVTQGLNRGRRGVGDLVERIQTRHFFPGG